jgi:hypothetical protein
MAAYLVNPGQASRRPTEARPWASAAARSSITWLTVRADWGGPVLVVAHAAGLDPEPGTTEQHRLTIPAVCDRIVHADIKISERRSEHRPMSRTHPVAGIRRTARKPIQ